MSNVCNEGENQLSSPDDFELLPEANFEAMMSSLLHANCSSNQTVVPSIASNGTMNEELANFAVLNHIRREHQFLRDELSSQSALLRDKIEACEERDRKRSQEISLIKNELNVAKRILSEKEIREVELERQIRYFKERSEKMDVMAARLMESDVLIKHQRSIIQQFQNDGLVNLQLLEKELEQKEQRIKRMETALVNVQANAKEMKEKDEDIKKLENALGALHRAHTIVQKEMERMKITNKGLQELVTELQNQATGTGIKVLAEGAPLSTDRPIQINGEIEKCANAVKGVHNICLDTPIKGPSKQYDTINYDPGLIKAYGEFPPDRNWRGPHGGRSGSPGFMPSQGQMRGGPPRSLFEHSYGDGYDMAPVNRGMGRGGPSGIPPLMGVKVYGCQEVPPQASQVSVPNNMTGAIIGNGGQRISRIREDSGAHILIDPPEHGKDERVISITGTPQEIRMAQYLMQQCVRSSAAGRRSV